jgi:hypothetical protein
VIIGFYAHQSREFGVIGAAGAAAIAARLAHCLAGPADTYDVVDGVRLGSVEATDVAAYQVNPATDIVVTEVAIAAIFPEVAAAANTGTDGIAEATTAIDADKSLLALDISARIHPFGSAIAIDACTTGSANRAVIEPRVAAAFFNRIARHNTA